MALLFIGCHHVFTVMYLMPILFSNIQVKSIFEKALAKGMESYKQSEMLWMSYVEHIRRKTDFNDENQVQLLRNTFRLAWDSLAEVSIQTFIGLLSVTLFFFIINLSSEHIS